MSATTRNSLYTLLMVLIAAIAASGVADDVSDTYAEDALKRANVELGLALSDDEIDSICAHCGMGEQNFVGELMNLKVASEEEGDGPALNEDRPDIYDSAVEVIIREGRGAREDAALDRPAVRLLVPHAQFTTFKN